MSYQVLARKWRPRNFSEMAGQEHVLKALINALDNNRLHHAFLFTGTRGVGKTTLARILAKSINCEKGISSHPCGVCSACTEIDEGRYVDLIEVDAASRTKVEDTRELLENVQYAPSRGKFKVYLIDEVHMLSASSFNALLKTLEEPPPHIKFLLATTDPQRLPITVLSRCLQFNLKRMPDKLIQDQLEHILSQEGIEFENGSTRLIAKSADGSMRDGISLLDQAISFCGESLNLDDTRAMLGTINQQHLFDIMQALADQQAQALYAALAALDEYAPDYMELLNEINSILHRMALVQQIPGLELEASEETDNIKQLAATMSAEDIQLYYQIGINGRRDLPLAPDQRSGLEMVLLRMLAFRPVASQEPGKTDTKPAAKPTTTIQPTAATAPSAQETPAVASTPATTENLNWQQVVAQLPVQGLSQQLALNCVYRDHDESQFQLALDPSHANLLNEKLCNRLQDALNAHFGKTWKLKIEVAESTNAQTPAQAETSRQAARQEAAETAIASDTNVKQVIDTFDASIEPNSIKPV